MEEQRSAKRYPLRLRVAIFLDDVEGRPTLRGETLDVSIDGASVLSDANVFTGGSVTVMMALPPAKAGEAPTIVEARGRMVYTIHSAAHARFRIGLQFLEFKGQSKRLLKASLAGRG